MNAEQIAKDMLENTIQSLIEHAIGLENAASNFALDVRDIANDYDGGVHPDPIEMQELSQSLVRMYDRVRDTYTWVQLLGVRIKLDNELKEGST